MSRPTPQDRPSETELLGEFYNTERLTARNPSEALARRSSSGLRDVERKFRVFLPFRVKRAANESESRLMARNGSVGRPREVV